MTTYLVLSIYTFIKNYLELLISIYKISLQKCSSSMGTDGSEVFGCRLVTEVDGEPSAIPYSLATNISLDSVPVCEEAQCKAHKATTPAQ